MKDESVKIPVLYAFLLVCIFIGSISSSPAKQFIEGESATSTIPLMEPLLTLDTGVEIASTTEPATSTSTEEVTEELLDIASSTEESMETLGTASTTTKIVEEVIYESQPIETLIKKEVTYNEFNSIDELLYRTIPEEPVILDFRKCQTSNLSSKYKNPGECIRALREE